MERPRPTPLSEVTFLFSPPVKQAAEVPRNGKSQVLFLTPDIDSNQSATISPIPPLFVPADGIDVLSTIRATFDARLEKLKQMHKRLPGQVPTVETITAIAPTPAPRIPKPLDRPRDGGLLPGMLLALDRLTNTPLLPAPPAFEEVFKPFEPIFHTIFYRKYPWYIRDDAKQEALLALWQSWKRDMSLLDQTRAYVTQAALWRASPWGKKRAKIDANEAPMPKHERYFSGGKQPPTSDAAWVQRIDLTYDLALAIQRARMQVNEHPDSNGIGTVLEDFLHGVSIAAGRKRSGLRWRVYTEYRKLVVEMLREALAEYNSDAKKCNGEVTVDSPSGIIYQRQLR